MLLTSSQNTKLKSLKAYYKDKKIRQADDVYICEGINLCKDIPSSVEVLECFVKESAKDTAEFFTNKLDREIHTVKDELLSAVADTKNPSGVICIVKKTKTKAISGEKVAVLCAISDPGNLGTIIRTAVACGIEDIICIDCTDPFSPKAVRSAMGGTYYANIIECDTVCALKYLVGYELIGLDMGGMSIYSYKRTRKTAIIVGSEAHGIPDLIKEKCDYLVSLPMEQNKVESLNAAVSMGIAMYLIK